MRNNLRVRLTIIFIGLAVGPLLLVGARLFQTIFADERKQAVDLQQQVAQRASSEVEAFLQDVQNDLRLLIGEIRGLEEEPDRAQRISLLLGALNSGTYRDVYEEFVLLDGQGQEQLHLSRDRIFSAEELSSRLGRDEYEQPKATGDIYFSPVWFDDRTGRALMTIAIPYSELRSVQLNGVLVANIRFKTVGDLIAGLQVGEGQTIYIVDSEGRVVTHPNPSIALRSLRFDIPESESSQIGLVGTEVVLATDSIQLGDQELSVVAERPEAEALAAATDTAFTIITTLFIALLVAVGLGFLIIRQVVRPIEAMSRTAQHISAGDLSQQVEVTGRDELGTLAEAFNSMTHQLRGSIGSLEQRVVQRTQRLEIVATLSERLTAILDLDQLLVELVEQVKSTFDYYHAHVYLLDEAQQNLVMTAGAGEAGAQMKAAGHHIPLNAPTSLVARAARQGQIVRADNVRQVADWLPNPLLPDTYSEMAVPIILAGQVVGVLDVQEDQIAGLDEGDESLLRSLANHVAVAIRNARLFDEVQTALRLTRELQRRYIIEGWDRNQVARRGRSRVQFSVGESHTLSEEAIAQAKEAALAGQELQFVTLGPEGTQESLVSEITQANAGPSFSPGAGRALVAPITLQDVLIGNLQLHEGNKPKVWTESELALIRAVIDQVAQTAENLRLVDSIQERANRERLIGEISAKLRRAPDMETLLEIGATELAHILNPARTFIQLGTQSTLADTSGEAVSKLEAEGRSDGR